VRICFLTPYHASWTKQEISILEELGHVVYPLYIVEYGKARRFPYIRFVSGLYGYIKMLVKSIPYCFKSDLIYCWFVFPTGVFGVLVGKLLRKKVILNAVGCDVAYVPMINYGDPAIWYFRPFISWALKNATEVIAVSKESARWAMTWGGKRADVIYEGIDTEKFKPSGAREHREERKEYVLLSVSSLAKGDVVRKDFDTLLKALSLVVKVFPNVKLVIVGEKGSAYPVLNQTAKSLKIENNVVFKGLVSLPRLIRLYNECDVFVLPSLHEGFPTVCAEAQACEKPVVTTNVSSMPEVVKNAESGVLVNLRSPEELANAVLELLKDEGARLRMGRLGRKLVRNNFSRDVRRRKLAELFESVGYV